ncbi:glutamine--fructose-6-phosphate transaminase (isomerizing) [Putridiphycobacter roseus]|uniref:Glutamine--fructose-6-phosphate aminotransferase [isomerizing] n=1 Tax=Putridiphycobacter roseus TaxID=2219161 RepID=A0A2W1MZC5_9FLAO|nr:glutamine--fructose-6-phosphate transaminase (isomerizing) [Putridiphycobacter roseus]PZE16610.1 glutamine--fructose-6-phosphate transaminase (isomerizing) [Putridiphycobacter roseus]
MCGIVGYIGNKRAYPVLIKGLSRLEYRGYDSAGVALLADSEHLNIYKRKGKVQDLVDFIGENNTQGNIGIGHTRWATHGEPNDVNAHPHFSSDGNIALVHNGIIENYAILKKELINRGHIFKSETDTEVLIHLIEEIQHNTHTSLEEAVRLALNEVVGAYAIVILSKNEPDKLIAAKKSSPLVIGLGENEYYIASDATPIVEYTKNVVYLEDEQIAIINKDHGFRIINIANKEVNPYVQELEMQLEALEKGGYEHFMLKEIYEQPRAIHDSFRGRLNAKEGWVSLGGVKPYIKEIANADRIVIIACGTSWHAALVAEYYFEDLARIPVEVEYASEFRYRNPIIRKGDVVIAISQSGETADTLAALKMAKENGAFLFGIVNVVGSSISRITDSGSYTHAGPEIGVASTKAFTTQVTLLAMMAMMLGKERNTIAPKRFQKLLDEMEALPDKIETLLESNDYIETIAAQYKDATNALYLGRGTAFPIALEGALKLKEISYIHAEGYPAAEMKHGPIALIDENMPVFVIATEGENYEKVVSNIQEVKARKGKIIAIVTKGDTEVKAIADHTISIPSTDEVLVPILATIPFQLLSYHIAVMRGCNVDQPRNLAKSVTVE